MRQIQEYWIDELKEIKEFKAIAEAENLEFKLFNDTINNLIDDQFIQTATERGVARREKLLKISAFADDTLETRRFRVQSRWNEQLPYTYNVLRSKLDQLCGKDGYAIALNTGLFTLNIKIELTKKRMFNEVQIVTRKIVPANMLISVELRYNQYFAVAKLTHAQLSAFAHKAIREEAL